MSDSANLWTTAHQASLSFTTSQSLLKLMSIQLVMPSNHLILCRHLLLSPSIFSSIRVFFSELALCIRWPKYWSLSISPSNEYSGLISFRIDWFDLLFHNSVAFSNVLEGSDIYTEGNGNPLQYSCLENPMDGGAWQATVHGVAKSQTRLSDFTYLLTY